MTAYEHMAFFRFKTPPSSSETDGLIDAVLAFPDSISGIVNVSAGINETDERENMHGYTLGLRVTFADRQALLAYQPHPTHQAFVRKLDGLLDSVVVMDYPVPSQRPAETNEVK